MPNTPYTAIVKMADGHEERLDLAEKGWRDRINTDSLLRFTLHPKAGPVNLSSITIDLKELPSGEEKRLVYFSRAFNRMAAHGNKGTIEPLFRLYCVGWQATVDGKNIKSLNWLYPDGSIVSADEPLFIKELMEYFWNNLPQGE